MIDSVVQAMIRFLLPHLACGARSILGQEHRSSSAMALSSFLTPLSTCARGQGLQEPLAVKCILLFLALFLADCGVAWQ